MEECYRCMCGCGRWAISGQNIHCLDCGRDYRVSHLCSGDMFNKCRADIVKDPLPRGTALAEARERDVSTPAGWADQTLKEARERLLAAAATTERTRVGSMEWSRATTRAILDCITVLECRVGKCPLKSET